MDSKLIDKPAGKPLHAIGALILIRNGDFHRVTHPISSGFRAVGDFGDVRKPVGIPFCDMRECVVGKSLCLNQDSGRVRDFPLRVKIHILGHGIAVKDPFAPLGQPFDKGVTGL